MATLVCRGLQSCLDPHLVQEPMATLRLKLVSPKITASHHSLARSLLDLNSPSPPHCHPLPQQLLEDPNPAHHHHHHPFSSSSSNPHLGQSLGGWSFLHALSTTSYGEPSATPDQEPPVYVHPLARASSLRLSPRSLDLCTENLGSESSNIVPSPFGDDDGDPRDESKSATREQTATRPWSTRQIMNVDNVSKKAKPRTNIDNSNNNSGDFPPPLTTIANDSIRVRPHRGEGRLILEVVRAPQGNRSCLRAERSHGRLRLCFFKDESPLCFDSEEEGDDGGEKDVEAGTEGDAENETAESDVEEEGGGTGEELLLVDEEEEEEEDEEEEGEAEQDGDGDDWEEEGMEGSDGIVGGKPGMEMLHHRHRHRHPQRSSCCKGGGKEHESNRRLFDLEAFLVGFS
ncbi:protein FANTASTIC FOUR 1 isoform X2 [Rhodamnia argentea]|uniref:Protein FANTASTIC FOUR 1 isoform X2 n=1 Tax=Rhodamnia argentea TaxID=178133 RepID=A0ABM3HIT7_9MYRT|nr:protein FANTASTIC FOUR 1 isoform X2 [Rhodamnia argentea]